MTKSLRNHEACRSKPSTNTTHQHPWKHNITLTLAEIHAWSTIQWTNFVIQFNHLIRFMIWFVIVCMIHTQFAVVICVSFVSISASPVTPQSHPCLFCSRALRLLHLLYFFWCFSSVTSYTSVALARLQYYTAAFPLLLLRWSAILPDSAVVSLDSLSTCPLPDARITRIAPIPVTPTGKAYVDPELLSCVL